MTKRVITVEPMVSVEDAARRMMEERIGALPVTEGGTLVGIVTETDVLLLFVRAMGILEPSSRLDVLLPDAPASLGRVVHTIESAGAAISSIVTLANPSLRLREAVVRVTTINPGPVIKALEAQGYTLRNPKRVDR
jgi:acetoin utilization protein AcuB